MKAGTRALVAFSCALALTAIVAMPASAAGGERIEGKRDTCFSETRRDLGADYVYTLKVRNLSCAKGERLVKKFHECRHSNGGANGHCSGVKGYSCNEKKLDSSPQLLQAKATCKKGSKKFKQVYGESL